MEEQLTPTTEMKRPSSAPWIVLAFVVILAAVAVYFLTAKKGPAPVALAEFLPQESVAAYTVDLSKTSPKQAALDVIQQIAREAGVENPEKWAFEKIGQTSDIDWQKDVLPKLTYKAGFAMMANENNPSEPDMTGVIGAKSEKDALALYDLALKNARSKGTLGKELTYQGVKYSPVPDGAKMAYAGVMKDVLIYSSTEAGLKKIVDTSQGRLPSIADQQDYRNLLQVKPSTVFTEYMSGVNYYNKLIKPSMMQAAGGRMPDDVVKALEGIFTEMQSMVAWGDATGDGIKMESTSITKSAWLDTTKVKIDDLAAIAPSDAAVVMSGTGAKPMWTELKKRLFVSKTIKDGADQVLQMAKMSAGFDPLKDLLDRIDSWGIYYVPRPMKSAMALPGHVVLVLGVDKPAVVESTVSRIKGMIAMAAPPGTLSDISVAGQKVTISPDLGDGMRVGFTIVRDKLIIALSGNDIKEALTGAVNAANGKGSTLADATAYKAVKKDLPAQTSVLIYADAKPVVGIFKSMLASDEQKVADAIVNHVSVYAAASQAAGTELRSVAIMPFRK